MGVVLDSSVLIAAEREKRPVSQLLSSLRADYVETEFVLSSITVMELEQSWLRANTPEEVFTVIPVGIGVGSKAGLYPAADR